MTEIEHRVEALEGVRLPDYSNRVFDDDAIAKGSHRAFIGGKFETHGDTQLGFLVGQGLQPHHKFLDVGCGVFRAGRSLIDMLDTGNYYGIDANHSLLVAGYDHELSDEQRGKLPAANLRANDRFDADFGVEFDMAIAQSVFTHISLNHVRLCLQRVARSMKIGGKFYATFFEQPAETDLDFIWRRGKGRAYLSEQNVFWYYRSDMRWASTFGPWQYRYIGKWDHPLGQRMVEFTRIAETPKKEAPKAAAPAKKAAPAAAAKAGQARRVVGRGLRAAARRLDAG